jgi:hypothetical protein
LYLTNLLVEVHNDFVIPTSKSHLLAHCFLESLWDIEKPFLHVIDLLVAKDCFIEYVVSSIFVVLIIKPSLPKPLEEVVNSDYSKHSTKEDGYLGRSFHRLRKIKRKVDLQVDT